MSRARPNELWSWDITRLLGSTKWTYYYLYVLLDVFSRYAVGWLLAQRESAALAEKLIAESCERQRIQPGQPTVHAAAMTSKPVALLLADLGVTQSHSRPRRSRSTWSGSRMGGHHRSHYRLRSGSIHRRCRPKSRRAKTP